MKALVSDHHRGRVLRSDLRFLQNYVYSVHAPMCDIDGCSQKARAFYADSENYGWQLCSEHEQDAGVSSNH